VLVKLLLSLEFGDQPNCLNRIVTDRMAFEKPGTKDFMGYSNIILISFENLKFLILIGSGYRKRPHLPIGGVGLVFPGVPDQGGMK